MNRKLFVILAVLLTGAVLTAQTGDRGESRGPGREIMEKGELKSVKGTLFSRDGRTWINSSEGELELIGRRFDYKDGDSVTAEGFVYEKQIMAVRLTIDGEVVPMKGLRGRKGKGGPRGGGPMSGNCPYYSESE